MKNWRIFAFATLMLTGLASCESDSDESYEAIADAFVNTTEIDGVAKHAVIYSVVAYNKIQGVEVTTPDNENVTLESYQGSSLSYYMNPEEDAYTESMPASGSYSFEVTFDGGETITATNTIGTSFVEQPDIESLVYQSDEETITLRWTKVGNAHGYQLKVFAEGEQIYSLPPFTIAAQDDIFEMTIDATTFYDYTPGPLQFEISALLFETSAYDKLQAIGSRNETIVID